LTRKWHSSRIVSVVVSLLAASVWAGVPLAAHAAFTPIALGDLIVSNISNSTVDEYTPSGIFVQTLMTGINIPTGSAFDGKGNLYVTEFGANDIRRLDATTGIVTVFSDNTILADGTSYNSPESVAFSSGFTNMYVSDANRFGLGGGIHVVDASTGKGQDFLPISSSFGSDGQGESDWLAFNASNNLYMTNENPTQGVMQVDLGTKDIVSPSFVPNLPNTGYAISFDKNGNLWVGDTDSILEYSPSGVLLQTITNPAFNTVFAAVFNPAGDTFYAGDNSSNGNVYTYDLSGTLQHTFSAGGAVGGLSVAGALLPNQTSVTTSLSGGGQSGATITVNAGTAVTDSATLTNNTSDAGGTVTYNVYSDNTCKTLVATGGTKPVTNGVVTNSDPVTLTTTGTFYWLASYSGDAKNAASDSGCGAETETVVEGLITATGTTFSATEGQSFTTTVATFTDPDTNATAAEYSALINWGDSNSSAGTISGGSGNFSVSGTHIYAEEGTYHVTVTITDTDNPSNTATANSTANVADAALTAAPACSATSLLSYNGLTATFTDAAGPLFGTLSDFSATINWGDGNITAGTVTGANGAYAVSGSHTYATTGTFTITTTIKDVGGQTVTTSCNTLGFTFAPGGGSFVIGDKDAAIGTSVTFWGAQWAKLNSLSGGTAPASFKGFAEAPLTPACLIGWSFDPGNSTPPPPGPLPAFMGVIVTSSASMHGTATSGNTVHIVIVQTNPGYAPDPGHAGTGTVLAVFC